jgi:PelA/Pel-15E family pectate lyase
MHGKSIFIIHNNLLLEMLKILIITIAIGFTSCAQEYSDLLQFYDSAHHWYDIHDEERMIDPLTDQQQYEPSEIEMIADNIILFQKNNGGWPKNYDMLAVLTEEQIASLLEGKDETNTTFDNGTTYSQINYLAYAYTKTKIEKYKKACIKGIEFTLEAQYENGGWPQFYPDLSGYRKYITFNDGAMIGIMDMLNRIVTGSPDYSFLDNKYIDKVRSALDKGIGCILKCQIEENGVKNVWCQQHDEIDFHPQNARSFEPAAICNGESAGIVKFLMSIDNPSEEIINSVQSAVRWFEESKIYGIRVDWVDSTHADFIYHSTDKDRVVVEDPDAPPIWARFYELGTNKPLFCRRDGTLVYSMEEVERERRTGYAWYVDWPQEALDIYPEWQKKFIKEN